MQYKHGYLVISAIYLETNEMLEFHSPKLFECAVTHIRPLYLVDHLITNAPKPVERSSSAT